MNRMLLANWLRAAGQANLVFLWCGSDGTSAGDAKLRALWIVAFDRTINGESR